MAAKNRVQRVQDITLKRLMKVGGDQINRATRQVASQSRKVYGLLQCKTAGFSNIVGRRLTESAAGNE